MKKFLISTVLGLSVAISANAEEAIKQQVPVIQVKSVTIATNKLSTVGATVKLDAVRQDISVIGKIATAKLISHIAVDNTKSLTEHDSFYFKINELGGHVKVYENEIDLSNVAIFEDINQKALKKEKTANFIDVLNSNAKKRITAFISSARGGRKINNLAIEYTCLNSEPCEIILK